MKEFINKLIGRLEETRWTTIFDTSCIFENDKLDKCIKIVNELAEEYKGNDYWKIIYNKVCELEKKYANDGNTETVNDCIKLENLLQYFKEELRSAEEYNNTSNDTSTTNADRIRSMTDEELAEFISKYFSCEYECAVRDKCGSDWDCKRATIDWLQSEVEGK